MVNIKAFQGFTFRPQLYGQLLNKNMEYMSDCQLFHSFNSRHLVEKQILQLEDQEYMYIYEQTFLNFVSLGLMAQLSLQDYEQNRIKKHQKTLQRAHLNCQTYSKNHTGPVIVGAPHLQTVEIWMREIVQKLEPFAKWTTQDGRIHKLWRVKDTQKFIKAYSELECVYVLDGHHRLQAAAANSVKKSQDASEKQKWIQGLIYSTNYVRTFPQHRRLTHSKRHNIIADILSSEKVKITEIQDSQQGNNTNFMLLYKGKYYNLHFLECGATNSDELLQVEKLDRVLEQSLKKHKKEQSSLKYIPSILFKSQEQASQENNSPVFLTKPAPLEVILEMADKNKVMPAKSTWLEPKPCLHMVIRLPY